MKMRLGHADLKTVSIYIDGIGVEEDQRAGWTWSARG
jgi:hypothetical protein